MGGQPAAGSAGATPGAGGIAGTGGTTLESPPGFFVNGYLTSGPWLGWVFTFADSSGLGTTVSPQCAASCTPAWGAQACVNGTVAQDPTSGTFIGLAFHVNDPMDGEVGTWNVTGEGIFVSVSNPPPSARLQLQEPDTTSNDQRYCANLPATGTGLIPFSDLKTYCWGDPEHPSKELQEDTLIHEAAIIVPGSSAGPTPFDFCLVDIGPR